MNAGKLDQRVTVERSTSTLVGTAVAGEGFLHVYRGTGEVWLMQTKRIYEQISQLEKQVHGLKGEISELQGQVQKQGAQLALQQSGNLAGILKPAATEDPGTVGQLAKTLQGQENDFQQVILTLQVGMRDLAYMLPGSRTWLDYYTETLNKSLATSKARTLELQQWAKGQAPAVAPVLKQP